MLRQLFKYEFRQTAKVMLSVYGILALVTLFGALMLNGLSSDSLFAGLTLFFYILTVVALMIVVYIYVGMRFYKTMYSDCGYLTHTLPVAPSATLNVKLIVSFVWMFGAVLLTLLSVFLLIHGMTHGQLIPELFHALKNGSLAAELDEAFAVMGVSLGWSVGYFIGVMALSCLYYLLWLYASASIGQLFSQHKLAIAVIAAVLLYFINQIANLILLLTTMGSFFRSMESNSYVMPLEMRPALYGSVVLEAAFALIYYLITVRIVTRHLNLE